ncbi:MAG: hypothetical protein H7Z17_04010 [Fuerstia sp.]|nr:hypothetical protein [Fuerstiella sp.]
MQKQKSIVATVQVAHPDPADLQVAHPAAMVRVDRQVAVTAATVLPAHQVRLDHADHVVPAGRLDLPAHTGPVVHRADLTAATVPAAHPARMEAVVHRVAL